MTLSLRSAALVAGLSLIAMAAVAGFGYGYAFERLYVAGDAAATLARVQSEQLLFRLAIASFVVILILDALVAWALWYFFKPTSEALALLAAWLRLLYAALLGGAISWLSAAGLALRGASPDALVVAGNLEMFLEVWSWGLIVFGCHLLALGYIAYASGIVPKIIAALTLLAAVCYIGANLAQTLLLNYNEYKNSVDAVLGLPMALGELALAVWLIAKGGVERASQKTA